MQALDRFPKARPQLTAGRRSTSHIVGKMSLTDARRAIHHAQASLTPGRPVEQRLEFVEITRAPERHA